MPKIRIGLSTDFNLVGEQVGIGTTNPTARLDVAGQILADNTAGSGGVSTFREYQGFHQTQSNVSNTVLIDATTAGNLNSLSGEIRIDGDVTIAPDTSVTSGKIDSLTATDKFAVPLGDTNSRDNAPEAGTTRFNQDFGTLEFFDGVNWKTVNSYNRGGAAGRGVFGGGANPAKNKTIDYIQFNTLGNALDFGDLDVARELNAGASSSIRGLFPGGENSPYTAQIDYITIASGGNGIDFGDLSQARLLRGGCSSSSRGLFAGGRTPTAVDTIDFVEISTLGTALDFGDTVFAGPWGTGFSSPVRGVWAGGGPAPSQTDIIEYNTISSKGDAIDYGDLGQKKQSLGGCANSIRGLVASGYIQNNTNTNAIEFITISTGGNAQYFGSLTDSRRTMEGAASQTRGVFGGGEPSVRSDIDYVTIASTGDAQDFGDLTDARASCGTVSDSHGGLGGF